MSNQELISKAFKRVNDFKRHRSLAKTADIEGNREKQTYHSLKMYELFDALELTLRAIQRKERELEENN